MSQLEGELKKSILEIAGKYLNLDSYKIFFFGSRLDETSNERSDVDIGIEGPQKIPDVLTRFKTLLAFLEKNSSSS